MADSGGYAGLFDFIIVPIVIFILLIVGIVIGVSFHYTDPFMANVITNQTGINNYHAVEGIFADMDYIILFLFIGMEMAIVLRGYYLYSEPRALAIIWVISFFIVFFSFLLSNIFTYIVRSPALSYGTAYFKQTIFSIYDFPLVNTLMLGAYTVAVFSKLRRNQYG